jgi:hypothetical protein
MEAGRFAASVAPSVQKKEREFKNQKCLFRPKTTIVDNLLTVCGKIST